MAILGRRQPHAPIILRAGGQPSAARLLVSTGAAQKAAFVARSPHGDLIFKRLGALPPVARSATITAGSQAASFFARRPLFRPTIGTLIQYAPPAPTAPVAAKPVVYGQATSLLAGNLGHRPLFRPIILTVLQYAPPSSFPPVAAKPGIYGQLVSQQAAQRASRFRLKAGTTVFPKIETTYTYSGATYYEPQLEDEITAASIHSATLLRTNGTGATGNTDTSALSTAVSIVYASPLSGADLATLNATVAAHVPFTNFGSTFPVHSTRKLTSSGSVLSTDDIVLFDASGGTINVSLPVIGRMPAKAFYFKRVDSTVAHTVSISAGGLDNMEGGTAYLLGSLGGIVMIPTSSGWWFAAKY